MQPVRGRENCCEIGDSLSNLAEAVEKAPVLSII